MKKIKANIQLIEKGTQLVVGYYTEKILDTGEVIQVIIHRDTRYPDYWSVSEYTTGVSITPGLSDCTIAKTRLGVLNESIKYLNERLDVNNITLKQAIGKFLENTKLDYVNKL